MKGGNSSTKPEKNIYYNNKIKVTRKASRGEIPLSAVNNSVAAFIRVQACAGRKCQRTGLAPDKAMSVYRQAMLGNFQLLQGEQTTRLSASRETNTVLEVQAAAKLKIQMLQIRKLVTG